jgi:hypothetical protein
MLAMMRVTTSRPRPVPLPISLVVKNGSNICDCISSGMPGPLSFMLFHTKCLSFCVRISSKPPPFTSMASMALSIMFVHTWFSSPARAFTCGRLRSKFSANCIFPLLKLIVEHGKRVADAGMDIQQLLIGIPIHVREGFYRAHQFRYSLR